MTAEQIKVVTSAVGADGTLVVAPIDGNRPAVAVAIEDLDTPTVVVDFKRGEARRP